MQRRAPGTPVGIVTNAYRHGQQVVITDLEHLLDYEIGMNSIILVGSSSTFVSGGRLVTRRGYSLKYDLSGDGRA
jgi:precorrin-3B methylase